VPMLYVEAGQQKVMLDDVAVQAPGKYPLGPKPASLASPSPALIARTRLAAANAMVQLEHSRKAHARPSAPWTARKAHWIR